MLFWNSLAFSMIQQMLARLRGPYFSCDPHKAFSIVNEAEIDVFLELSCFFDDPTDVGNLISASSAFPKSSLNIWNFMVHILLKLASRILSITLLACDMNATVQ